MPVGPLFPAIGTAPEERVIVCPFARNGHAGSGRREPGDACIVVHVNRHSAFRRQLRRLAEAVDVQPDDVRRQIRRSLAEQSEG